MLIFYGCRPSHSTARCQFGQAHVRMWAVGMLLGSTIAVSTPKVLFSLKIELQSHKPSLWLCNYYLQHFSRRSGCIFPCGSPSPHTQQRVTTRLQNRQRSPIASHLLAYDFSRLRILIDSITSRILPNDVQHLLSTRSLQDPSRVSWEMRDRKAADQSNSSRCGPWHSYAYLLRVVFLGLPRMET